VLRWRAWTLVDVSHHTDALRAQGSLSASRRSRVIDPQHLTDAAADHALARQAGLAAPGVVHQAIDLVFTDHANHVGDRIGDHLIGVQVGAQRPAGPSPQARLRPGRQRLAALGLRRGRFPRSDVEPPADFQGSACWPGT
jgi:hypothetical protein